MMSQEEIVQLKNANFFLNPKRKRSVLLLENKGRSKYNFLMDRDIIYFSGLFDGEGSVGIYKASEKGSPNHTRLCMCLGQKETQVLYWIKEKFGGLITIREYPKVSAWYLRNPKNVLPLLKRMYPYLLVKKEAANKILTLYNNLAKEGRIYRKKGKL